MLERFPLTAREISWSTLSERALILRSAFPKWLEGRDPHCHFLGLLRLYSRYGAPDRSAAQGGFFHGVSALPSYTDEPSVSYRSIDNSPGGTLLHT